MFQWLSADVSTRHVTWETRLEGYTDECYPECPAVLGVFWRLCCHRYTRPDISCGPVFPGRCHRVHKVWKVHLISDVNYNQVHQANIHVHHSSTYSCKKNTCKVETLAVTLSLVYFTSAEALAFDFLGYVWMQKVFKRKLLMRNGV